MNRRNRPSGLHDGDPSRRPGGPTVLRPMRKCGGDDLQWSRHGSPPGAFPQSPGHVVCLDACRTDYRPSRSDGAERFPGWDVAECSAESYGIIRRPSAPPELERPSCWDSGHRGGTQQSMVDLATKPSPLSSITVRSCEQPRVSSRVDLCPFRKSSSDPPDRHAW